MRRLITSIALCLTAIAAMSQNKADIEVSYKYEYPNFKSGAREFHSDFILLANAKESKFFSPMTEYLDGLESTPEGKAKINELTKAAFNSGKYDDIPQADGTFYVIKHMPENQLINYEILGINRLYSVEEIPQIDWEISDSTKTVLDYECTLATAELYGRKWIAWFAADIPVLNGPWKLSGLPGLILEAESADGLHLFTATGLQRSEKPITPIYLADEYDKVERRELQKAKRQLYENPLGVVNSQGGKGVKVAVIDENGNLQEVTRLEYAPREEADFLETDY